MSKFINLTGERFGRLLAIECIGRNNNNQAIWKCICDCGNETKVICANLKSGGTRSCGCLHVESCTKRSTSHGMAHTRIYNIWCGIIQRCTNENALAFKNYGGRGVFVCKKWETFNGFYEDMGDPPSTKHEIDRRDNNSGYNKDNCRWATKTQQNRNRRCNRIIEVEGKKYCLAELAEQSGLQWSTLATRLKLGWSIEKAISTPLVERRLKLDYLGKTYSLTELATETGISQATLCRRLKSGWSVESAVTTPTLKQYER